MAKPLLSADAIYDEALCILAEEGSAALTVRNLAGRLRCSNKTLYQQVGNHEALIRGVVARAFGAIELDFTVDTSWQDGVRSWCLAMRRALFERPDLCTLMTTADRKVVITFVGRLMEVLQAHGFSHREAVHACGILAHVTLSMTLSDVAAPGQWDDPRVFETTVGWLMDGMAKGRAAARHRGAEVK